MMNSQIWEESLWRLLSYLHWQDGSHDNGDQTRVFVCEYIK